MFVVAIAMVMVSLCMAIPDREPIPFEKQIPLPPIPFAIIPDRLYLVKQGTEGNRRKKKWNKNPTGEKYAYSKNRRKYNRTKGHIA